MHRSSSYRIPYSRNSIGTSLEEQKEPFFSPQRETVPSFFQAKGSSPAGTAARYASTSTAPGSLEGGAPLQDVFNPGPVSEQPDGDLKNPRFKGDPELEACYDGQHLLRTGSQGQAVASVQSGIRDYFQEQQQPDPLPLYGADGMFGSETRNAVIDFQENVGFSGKDVDGIIGHDTMEQLDEKAPGGQQPQPKPKPQLPEQECEETCKALSKVTKKNKNGSLITFRLCDDKFKALNSGAGTVTPGPGCLGTASNTKGHVNFSAHSSSGNGWELESNLESCPGPNQPAKSEWEVGFIQTLDSATYGASYGNGHFTSVTNSNARDALLQPNPTPPPAKTAPPAPWYDVSGGNFGPRDAAGPSALLWDSPNVDFDLVHPNSPAGKPDFLQSVCMKAKFNIWLIINEIGKTPSISDVDFLHHWSVNMNHKYKLSGELAHPCNKAQWLPIGRITGSSGSGQGSATPVWDKPVANGNEVRDTSVKTDPCAAPATPTPGKDKPAE